MKIDLDRAVGSDEARSLYAAVGWTAYTRDVDVLLRALAGSHLVVSARDDQNTLVGLARTISDGVTICYLQDLLVRPEHQGSGVGRALLARVRREYPGVRQFLLMTDADGPQQFYRAAGLVPFGELGLVGYVQP